jgi:hypothetical protein
MLRTTVALLLFFSAAAAPADAGELKLTIANGRATLIAQDVPVRQILAEWSRLGGTKIINGDKLMGPPVTLHIIDKPEREVLETLLRSASGYVASPRTIGSVGVSAFEAVMIMPTSRPPAVTASGPPAFNQRPGFPQPQPMPQQAMPVVEDDEDREVAEQGVVPPPGVMPQPGMMTQPGMMAQPGVQPQVQPYPGMMQQPAVQPGMQQPGMQQPQQQVPMTSPRPGVVPPPQPVPGNPYQPQPPVRRPGGEGI